MKEYGQASWCWKDIQRVRPEWDKDQCEAFLEKYSDKLIDCMVEEGWHFIHDAVREEESANAQS